MPMFSDSKVFSFPTSKGSLDRQPCSGWVQAPLGAHTFSNSGVEAQSAFRSREIDAKAVLLACSVIQ
eukprot:6077942-Amphidinium_carterae.1